MSRQILIPILTTSKGVGKCARCNLDLKAGEGIALVPALVKTEKETALERVRVHTDCMGQLLEERWTRDREREAAKQTEELKETLVGENPCRQINLAEAAGQSVEGPRYELSRTEETVSVPEGEILHKERRS